MTVQDTMAKIALKLLLLLHLRMKARTFWKSLVMMMTLDSDEDATTNPHEEMDLLLAVYSSIQATTRTNIMGETGVFKVEESQNMAWKENPKRAVKRILQETKERQTSK